MNVKDFLRYFYPGIVEEGATGEILNYRIGLILILSVSCSLCTLYYYEKGDDELKQYTITLSIYFLALPSLMKYIGHWNIFGLLCCVGWLISNIIIGNFLPRYVIGLNFFQSLIPSYMLLATEEYSCSFMAAVFVGAISVPYQYNHVYEEIVGLDVQEAKTYIITILHDTRDLNKYHLMASFGLTLWMSFCKKREVSFIKSLKEAAESAKKSTEIFFAAFSHEFRNPLNA